MQLQRDCCKHLPISLDEIHSIRALADRELYQRQIDATDAQRDDNGQVRKQTDKTEAARVR